jgi:hypothetical protein
LVDCFYEVETIRETSREFRTDLDRIERPALAALAERVEEAQRVLDERVESLLGFNERIDSFITERHTLNRSLVEQDAKPGSAPAVLSYLVGVGFGRWAIETNVRDRPVDATKDLWESPSWPAALSSRTVQSPDVLMDAPGDPRDLPSQILRIGSELRSSDWIEQIAASLPGGSLSAHLRRRFFADHLKRYSMLGRKAPIYWQLQVPSKAWGLWLYAPRLSREMLFAVVREAEKRQRLADQQIARLQAEAVTGGGGRSASEVAKELDAEQSLAVELATFRAEAERIANLGWEPDLDDGMVLNAAPLADLFPAWKDAAKYRDELRAGKYEWAKVAQYADQL